MNIEQYNEATEIVEKINEAKAELGRVNEMIAEVSGTAKVKVNQQWIINLPAQSLKGHAQARKAQLDQEIIDLTTELMNV